MSSHRRALYVGVTGNLARRVNQHKSGSGSRFSRRYNVTQLVYAEATDNVEHALNREKQIKNWNRRKKIDLVLSLNPEWNDLAVEWGLTAGKPEIDDAPGLVER